MHRKTRALFAPAAAAALLLAACNPASAPAPGGDAAGGTSAAAPAPRVPSPPFQGEAPKGARRYDVSGQYGGGVSFPLIGNPRTFNAILANETSSTDVLLPAMVSTLIDYDRRTGDDIPELAESWTHSEDFQVWEFKLREGIQWSDGHPITADDVLFSYEVVMDPQVQTSIKSVFEDDARPSKVEKLDERTVRFTLTAPKYHYLINVGNLYVQPKHVLEPIWKAGKFATDAFNTGTPPEQIVVSGPFRLKEYVSDQRVVLERNPYFYGVDRDGKRLPYLDTVTFLITPNIDTSMLKFKNGEVDALEPYVYPKDYQAIKADEKKGDYTVQRIGWSYNTNFWWFNQNPRSPVAKHKLKWFRDRRFRKAIAHTVDREGIVRTVLFGMGEPLWGFPSQGNKKWHNPDIVHHDYDIEKAKGMLEELGFKDRNGDGLREDPDGKPFTFTIQTNSNNTDRVRTLAILIEDLKKAGIDAKAEPVDFNALVGKIRTSYDYEAVLLGLSTAVPPVPMLSVNVLRSSGITHYWNPQQKSPDYPWEATIDKLVSQLESTAAYEEQRKLYDQVQAILAEEAPWFTTVVQEYITAVKNKVKNASPSPLRPTTYWNIAELWVDPIH